MTFLRFLRPQNHRLVFRPNRLVVEARTNRCLSWAPPPL